MSGKPNTPTAAQLAQLATLTAATAAAQASYDAVRGPHGTLHATKQAYLNALATQKQYEAYIYGGQKPGIIDEGGANVT
jgi:hypothetical protein